MFRIIKEPEKPKKEEPKLNEDLVIISRMNQEFAISLDLNETLKTALELIVKRLYSRISRLQRIGHIYNYRLVKKRRYSNLRLSVERIRKSNNDGSVL